MQAAEKRRIRTGIDLENVGSIRVIEDIVVETGAFADKACTRISDWCIYAKERQEQDHHSTDLHP